MASGKLFCFHLLAWLESAFGLWVYHFYINSFRKPTYGGHWKFLTYINMNIQFVCFSLCVLTDILYYVGFKSFASVLHRFKDYFYASIGLPSCLAVFVSFWTIFLINRELVYPAYLDEIIPTWANHVWHSAILITVIEVMCDRHKYPRRSFGISLVSAFGIGYLVWVEWVYRQSGVAVYPILKELKGVWYFLFVVTEIFFSWLAYLFGEFINYNFGKTYKVRMSNQSLTRTSSKLKKENKKKK